MFPMDREHSSRLSVRAYDRESDATWLRATADAVGGASVVSRGVLHHLTELPGFVALAGGERTGFAMYRTEGTACELVAIEATRRQRGAGTALLGAVEDAARGAGCRRLWLVTTNDNLDALRFYQRRGYRLARVHRDALQASRRLKPAIPAVGAHGIAIADEVELDKEL